MNVFKVYWRENGTVEPVPIMSDVAESELVRGSRFSALWKGIKLTLKVELVTPKGQVYVTQS